MLQSLLNALIGQVSNPSSPVTAFLSKILLHALGDKTSTVIGLAIGYVIQNYTNFAVLVPAQYAPYVQTGLAILVSLFGVYVMTPSKGAAITTAVNAQAK